MVESAKGGSRRRSRPARGSFDTGREKAAQTERLQRVLADAGVASRRVCEQLIENGKVEVNGQVVRGLPYFVDPQQDRIVVEGRPIRTGAGAKFGGSIRPLYLLVNKPPRTVCTTSDEYGRRTVMDLVKHPENPRLMPVGRLGFDATGLVLVTNDRDMINRLTHARYGVSKRFHIEVKGQLPASELAALEKKVARAGKWSRIREARAGGTPKRAGPVRTAEGPAPGKKGARVGLRVVEVGAGTTLLELTLNEGRNTAVDVVLKEAGHPVRRVTCVGLGPLELKGVAPGAWRELERGEIWALRDAAGLREKAGPKRRTKKGNQHGA